MKTIVKPKSTSRAATRSAAKLTSEERRAAIVVAVRQVFAEKGFHGTTTRELAVDAGVSEALLFKHFPNKEALYAAMQISCSQQLGELVMQRLEALEPSASTLVILIHLLVSHMLSVKAPGEDDTSIQVRLMLHSILEDGEFARLRLQKLASCWIPKIEECLQAAIAAEEAVVGPVRPNVRGWFVHQLAAGVKIHLLPTVQVVDYGLSREQLAEQVVWFALRGIGLTDAAIKRYYNPAALALFAG
ncbi:MAG TPA: helix-turn-helix domain-containing protein [Pirellulales bacterium]|jgi:AcrR family transcriptional regulator|nr:helix-turn-helix domain-containing protein [Pirellulales bacterium]